MLCSEVPIIPRESGERADLEEDLTRIGCIKMIEDGSRGHHHSIKLVQPNYPWEAKNLDRREVKEDL